MAYIKPPPGPPVATGRRANRGFGFNSGFVSNAEVPPAWLTSAATDVIINRMVWRLDGDMVVRTSEPTDQPSLSNGVLTDLRIRITQGDNVLNVVGISDTTNAYHIRSQSS